MDFSLHYFANRAVIEHTAEYALLIRTAEFVDQHGFTAIWFPERHFHQFGGAYPNPALAAAALSMKTKNLRLRAGSVVLPLHDPLTVAEDWSFVDNLSQGRVDMALAAGWNPNDFVLAPERFESRRDHLTSQITELRRLWAGGCVRRINGSKEQIDVSIYPPPYQKEIDLWLTCASNPAGFTEAGRAGLNVLTSLLRMSTVDLKEGIEAYRNARTEAGLDPSSGTITVMLHAFVGETDLSVRMAIGKPFRRYLKSSLDLWRAELKAAPDVSDEQVIEHAFERYFRTAALFGSVDRCVTFASRLAEWGVDEVSCLVDFGVDDDSTYASLEYLNQVRRQVQHH
jgi:natural product biosynthesis luciferase-like monooxygenase protein